MYELYQLEECPFSQKVRARMTDLGIDYMIRNVPRDKEKRERLMKVSGQKGVPTLVDPEKNIIIADDEEKIINFINQQHQK